MRHSALYMASLFVLSACGGGSNLAEDSTLYADTRADTVQAKLLDGETVKAKTAQMNAVLLDWETGGVAAVNPKTMAIRLPDGTDEDVTLILDGKKVTFTSADRQLQDDGITYYGWSQDGDNPRYSLWTWSNGPASNSISASGDSFVNVFEVFFDATDGTTYAAYSVSGTETRDEVLGGLGTASYSGWANIKAYPNGSYDGFETVQRLEASDVQMNADFGTGTISGSMGDLNWGWTGDRDARVDVPGKIRMEAATIASDGSYSGTLAPNSAFEANDVVSTTGGTFSGDFFGPAANQTAGAIGMSFEADGTDYVGTGIFNTEKITGE